MRSWPEQRHLVGRLARMPLPEIVGRSSQLATRLAGRFGLRRESGEALPVPASRRVMVPGLLSPRATAAAVGAVDSVAAASLLERAAAISEGEFEIMGFGLLRFGSPVDWHLDAVSGRRAPRLHFSRLDPLDVNVVGDHKIVWELNRHGWLVTLAQAYALTGDETHAREARRLLESWLEANPPAVGINWTSSLEVAFRLVAWMYAWPLFRSAPAFSPALCQQWIASADAHARHVRAFPSLYFSPNTHLTGEALALGLCGRLLPELASAERYRRIGGRLLDRELAIQIGADGFHYEQSGCYHRYTVELVLLDLLADMLNGWNPTGPRRAQLARAVDAMLPLVQPNGCIANIGDEDGGQLLRLGARDPLDARPLLAAAAILLGRGDLKAVAGDLPAETVWFLGADAVARYAALSPAGPPPSRVLASAGYAVLRSGWDAEADHLIIDGGPHGAERCGYGHAHADALSLNIVAAGRRFVIDPGTASYSDRPLRDEFRGTFAHSTAWVDGHAHCEPARAFGWQTTTRGRITRWFAGEEGGFVEAIHALNADRGDAVHHRRQVIYWKGHGWVVWDRFEGAGQREVTIQYVLAAAMHETVRENSGARVPAGALGVLAPVHAVRVTCELVPRAVSPRYGSLEPGTAYRVTALASLPADFISVIRGGKRVGTPSLIAHDGDSMTQVVEDATTGERIILGEPASGNVPSLVPPSPGCAAIAWLDRDRSALVLEQGLEDPRRPAGNSGSRYALAGTAMGDSSPALSNGERA